MYIYVCVDISIIIILRLSFSYCTTSSCAALTVIILYFIINPYTYFCLLSNDTETFPIDIIYYFVVYTRTRNGIAHHY
jgi:hypothetical protein